jgi:lipopolysaccharide transport system ATP-binding protein
MNATVIHGEGLGKRYRRGGLQQSGLLRDQLSRALKSPLSVFRRPKDEIFWALKDVSLEVREGEVLGLIGRNGAGKTTLLKILSRITRPTTGWAEITGRVGTLLEVGTGFHPELTGRENTYLNGAILGMGKQEISSKFDEIVAFAELEKFIDTAVKHYSSGMYVRLAFAVAAHLEPEILFVDEVLAVGDASFQKKCLGKMGDISRSGRTIVFVSHNMGAITQLCSRCLLIEEGEIIMAGSPTGVIAQYLSANQSNDGQACLNPEANPKSSVVMGRVWIAGKDGIPTGSVGVNDGFQIGVQVLARQNVRGVELSFRVDNSMHQPVFTSNLSDSGGEVISLEAGEHAFLIEVPGALLAPDTYSLQVAAHRPNVEILDLHEHVLSFRVEESGSKMWQYAGARYGSVLVNLHWRPVISHQTVAQLQALEGKAR